MEHNESDVSVWLIGKPIVAFESGKLPSKWDLLQRFEYFHTILKNPVRESSRKTIDEVVKIYEQQQKPTMNKFRAILLLEGIHKQVNI